VVAVAREELVAMPLVRVLGGLEVLEEQFLEQHTEPEELADWKTIPRYSMVRQTPETAAPVESFFKTPAELAPAGLALLL
jgi:hypothetical protein